MFLVLVVVNALASKYYARIDLTENKRYTLNNTSKEIAAQLKEKAYFKIYLDGEISAKYKRLRSAIRDMLYEFRNAANGNIEFNIASPIEGKDEKTRNDILMQLTGKGLMPYQDIESESADQEKRNIILPGGEVYYKDKSFAINFFNPDFSLDEEQNVSKAIEQIEFEIASSLRKCVVENPLKVAFIEGSGELKEWQVKDLTKELSQHYTLDRLNLNLADSFCAKPFEKEILAHPDSAEFALLNALQRRLNTFSGIVIAKPKSDYSMAELYLIDQFVMKGGKVIWLIDPINAENDSLRLTGNFLAQAYNFENINSTLFRYGVTINPDILMDLYCSKIKLMNPSTRQMEMFDWPFHPLYTSGSNHPAVRNLGLIWGQYSSTISVKNRPGLSINPVLVSSPRTKTAKVPAEVSIETGLLTRVPQYKETYKEGNKITGVLMEGKFRSSFQNIKHLTMLSLPDSVLNSMLVIADGDIARNSGSGRTDENIPLGFDRTTGQVYANKKFLVNCIDYLLGQRDLIELRAREISIPLLDREKIKAEKSFWQILNVGLPILLVVLFGFGNRMYRRYKYTR